VRGRDGDRPVLLETGTKGWLDYQEKGVMELAFVAIMSDPPPVAVRAEVAR